ncbi:hypothetical protein B0O99DRAFT_691173 [Bisporella sp. PMI_857]|nr:hypothetical protein B0O99DRAFT_691173 [Bisporella sp. PMI_857]
MSSTKTALKAIDAAIKAQKYEETVWLCEKLLQGDPKNYHANIFLGFALDKQSKYDDAERSYNTATEIKPADPQAWQGLIRLFEKQNGNKLDQYQRAALKLAEIYVRLDDKYKCQDVIDKFLGCAKKEGSRLQYRKAQEIVLPTSPIYDYLEGRIPHPAFTYQSIAQILEFEEKERINKEIGERRTRLGARIGQVTLEVKREVLRDSELEGLYSKIIDWANDDDIRRQYEEKLLQRCMEALTFLLPGPERDRKRTKVLKLASDMVIIKHPFRLAWDIAIEWQDPECIQDLDVNVLREYCAFFPTNGLTQVLRGYMSSEISPFPPSPPTHPQGAQDIPSGNVSSDSDADDDDGGGVTIARDSLLIGEDRLLVMVDGISSAPSSILAHRLMGEYYQYLDEYESTVELMRAAKRVIHEEVTKTGISFKNSSDAILSLLGTALVFYQSPKNHPEAKTVFEDLLSRKPTSTAALIGIGLVYEEEEDYSSAIDFLERALQRDTSNVRIKAEAAWVKALAGNYAKGKDELELCLPEMDGKDIRTRELLAQTQYRIGVCIWHTDTSKTGRKDRSGAYSYFIAALKSNRNYAPVYTSLGIFYADYSKDKKRARKCFQQAFELSASEVEAAGRLARIFAAEGDWELVEIIAQRVVSSGKVKPAPGSKKKGISWPFAALGVAELNKQDYAKSIASFQSALRIAPHDYHSWLGLGESYHNSGRYTAAAKAFQHAETFENETQKINSGETWFAKYMLANVKRELGDFGEAIDGYKAVLQVRPTESGISIALIQTLVESAWEGVDKGLFGYAVQRASQAIDVALELSRTRPDAFNLWRAVGDACSIFSWVQDRISGFPHGKIEHILKAGGAENAFDIFTDVDGVGVDLVFARGLYPKDEEKGINLTRCLHAAILSYKRAIHSSAYDVHAQAVAFYNLGWIEFRVHTCLSSGLKKRFTRYLKTAVRCFKRAIELEAGNSEFWNALGVVTSELNPKVAQHSFVRSLFLNERNAHVWTNLGALYLFQNDIQLANDAFTRAQSTDPDFAHAWIGQGIIALMTDNRKEADLLFVHAMEISDSSSLITKRKYSQSIFDHLISSKASSNIIDLAQPLFALKQINSMDPEDLTFYHLSALFLERINDIELSVEILSRISTIVDADYEVTESSASLSRYALAKADLARSQLAARQLEEAIESGDLALQLSAEDAGNELSFKARQKCRLSAHLTVGLAYYYANDPKTALDYFEPALDESNNNPDTVCLLAQVLWANGDDESRSRARGLLFDCIESNSEHVQSVILLGIIALLDKDTESLKAVTTALEDLRATHNLTHQEQTKVSEVLRSIATFSEGSVVQNVLTEIQTDLLLHPSQADGWGWLADFGSDDYAADMALKTAMKAVPPHSALDAIELSNAFAGTKTVGNIQKAIFVAPWSRAGWEALSDSLTDGQ